MSENQYLYRILSLRHVVDMFESSELHFASPSSWDDPFEQLLKHKDTGNIFAQCWTRRSVSDAMWRIYSPDHSALRIRVTKGRLSDALDAAKARFKISARIEPVSYLKAGEVKQRLNEIAVDLRKKYSVRRASDSLLIKRDSFDHEAEIRVILLSRSSAEIRTSCRVAIDPHSLIENIYFDPRVDPLFEKIAKHFLRTKLKYKGQIKKSSLYRVPSSIDVS